MRVDLPVPLAPTSAVFSLLRISQLASRNRTRGPYRLPAFCRESIYSIFADRLRRPAVRPAARSSLAKEFRQRAADYSRISTGAASSSAPQFFQKTVAKKSTRREQVEV